MFKNEILYIIQSLAIFFHLYSSHRQNLHQLCLIHVQEVAILMEIRHACSNIKLRVKII